MAMEEPTPLLPIYDLCLLHVRADRAMRNAISSQLEHQQLTFMEWLVMGVVSHAPKQGQSMSEIAGYLDVTMPQVTALVNVLTEKKLVKQTVSPFDRRGRQVQITTKGSRILARLEGQLRGALHTWSKDIPPNHLYTYALTLDRFAQQHVHSLGDLLQG